MKNSLTTKKTLARPELGIIITTIILSLLGLLFVFEASVAEAFTQFGNQMYFVSQQFIWLLIGGVSLLVCSKIPTLFWQKISPYLFGASFFLLACVFLPGLGREVNGAHRWLFFPGFSLQPVEVMKFALVIFFANWLEKHQKLAPFLFLTFLPIAILFLQPDMGSALIVIAIAFGMYFVAGAPLQTFVGTGVLGVVALLLLVVTSPYRLQRVTTFLNPEADPLGSSFHIRQLVIALGNGGFFGQGIGKSRQKFSYIPEASTDSIFAIVAEEVGFVGSLGIFALFILFIRFCFQAVKRTVPGSYDHLLGMGILIWLSMQICLNLGSVVALVPLTGVPLPFFSYGGSSLVMILSMTGILIGLGVKYRDT